MAWLISLAHCDGLAMPPVLELKYSQPHMVLYMESSGVLSFRRIAVPSLSPRWKAATMSVVTLACLWRG